MCYLRLYVKGRGRGVLSKSAIFNNVVFFDVVFERTPPTAFVRSASKFFSQLTRCHLRKVVLFATPRQRAWPWRAVKVGHFEFSRIFFQCLFFPMFGNQLLPGILSVWLQNLSVQSEDGAEQILCSFATLRQRAWPWRAVKVGSVVFFSKVAFRQSWPFSSKCQTVMPFVPIPNPYVNYYESPCECPDPCTLM